MIWKFLIAVGVREEEKLDLLDLAEHDLDGLCAVHRFEQTGEVFDLPAVVTLDYADGRSTDVVVSITERVAEIPVKIDGALRAASISKKDNALVQYR